jgi:hypothetical protein
MKFDLHKFKKIKEDNHSAVLQHPEGHKITISKKVLSPELKKQVAGLPMHMAEGGQVTDEELMAEAKALNGPKNLAMNRPDEAMKSAAGYQPEFPEPTPVQMAQGPKQNQPTIIINNGPKEEAAPTPAPKPDSGQPDYFTNGTFDFNKFAIHSKEVPLEAKMRALREIDAQENQAKQNSQMEAQQKQAAEQTAYQQAMDYNQMAAQRGIPGVPVPNMPAVMPGAVADAGMAQPDPAMQAQASQPQMPQAPSDPYGTQAYSDTLSQGIQNVKSGIQSGAEAEAQLGQQQADVYGQQANAQQQVLSNYQNETQALNQERQAFMQDYDAKHVDPNRFLNNQTTGQRIMTGIGLILGGIGGGLTHQENPALKMLNAQIDRDIKAQEAELGKSENLLTANFRQFGNIKDASQMTEVMQTDILKSKIAESAAKSQDPIVRSRAQQAIGELDMKNANLLSQIAMRRSLTGSSGDPATKLRMLAMTGMIPEGQVGPAYKELEEAQKLVKTRDEIVSGFKKIAALNTMGNRIRNPIQSGKQIKAIMNPLLMELSKDAAGKFSEMEYNELTPLMNPGLFANDDTINVAQNKLLGIANKKMNFPILKSYGISFGDVPAGGRYDQSGQKRIQLGAPVATGQSKSGQ